jgi:hypothetical protein
LLIRRIVSAITSATESWRMRGDSLRVVAQRNGVGDDQFVEIGVVDALDGMARKYRMHAVRKHLLAPCSLSAVAALHRVPAVSTRSSMITQVRPSTSPMMFITSETLAFGTTLVDDRQIAFETLGQRAGADDTADVGRDDHQVVEIFFQTSPSMIGSE